MEELFVSIAKQSPTIGVLIYWVYCERVDKRESLKFYRGRIAECQDMMKSTLDKVVIVLGTQSKN